MCLLQLDIKRSPLAFAVIEYEFPQRHDIEAIHFSGLDVDFDTTILKSTPSSKAANSPLL